MWPLPEGNVAVLGKAKHVDSIMLGETERLYSEITSFHYILYLQARRLTRDSDNSERLLPAPTIPRQCKTTRATAEGYFVDDELLPINAEIYYA
jgi:hypothetical protein